MTLTQDAGIVDLRSAWLLLRNFAWSSAGEEVDDDGGAPSPSGAPSIPADTGGDDDDEHDGDEPTVGDVRDPERQKLSREAARYRTSAKAEKDRADAAETRIGSLEELVRGLVAQNAFLRAAGGTIADVDAAWKLADHDALTINDDGTVDGIDGALAQVIERYPYVAAQPTTEPDPLVQKFPALLPSGRPTNAKRKTDTGALNVAALAAKYPALGRRKR